MNNHQINNNNALILSRVKIKQPFHMISIKEWEFSLNFNHALKRLVRMMKIAKIMIKIFKQILEMAYQQT